MKLVSTFSLVLTLVSVALAAVLGVDFGEEYTKAALVAPGVPFELVLSQDSKRKDTSGITFRKLSDKDVERSFGNNAMGLWSRYPESSAFYYKPLLGASLTKNPQVDAFKERQPSVQLTESNNNRNTIAYEIHGEKYPVEEILGMTLSKVRDRAADLLTANSGSGYVKDVSITVPPYFTTEQRRAMQDAVEVSGLKLISLVNDGIAVAMNFAQSRKFTEKKQYNVIYDVGAGSTVATLVSFRHGDYTDGDRVTKSGTIVELEAVGYNTVLGGHTLTGHVQDLLLDKFVEQNKNVKKSDVMKDSRALNKLWREAEKVKIVLSANIETQGSIESLYRDIDFKTKVTREEFEKSANYLFEHSTDPISQLFSHPIGDAVKLEDVESIILTGGSVRVPFVKAALQKMGDDAKVPLAKNVNADEAAVLGATLRGVGISKIFKSKDIRVIDKTIWGYSIAIDGKKQELFPVGSELGTTKTLQLDKTSDFDVELFENGRDVGKFVNTGISKAVDGLKNNTKKECVGEIAVEAEFELTHNRVVELNSVYATCLAKDKPKPESWASSSSSESSSTMSKQSETESATESSTETTTAQPTETEKPARQIKKFASVKTKYETGQRPMGTASKQSSASRLRSMDRSDTERRSKEEARNKLEGTIYRVKDFLSDLEEPGSALEKLEQEFTDWLDIDGQSATLKQLNEKQKSLENFRKSFDPQVEPVSTATQVTDTTTSSASATSTEPSAHDVHEDISQFTQMLQALGVNVENGMSLDTISERLEKQLDKESEIYKPAKQKLEKLKQSFDSLKGDQKQEEIVHEDL